MPKIHQVPMTHRRCDLIRDALEDVIASTDDRERAEELQSASDDLLATFDLDHMKESRR
jgi:hypothetical protein